MQRADDLDPAPRKAPHGALSDELQTLHDLHQAGALSPEEYVAAKTRLLTPHGAAVAEAPAARSRRPYVLAGGMLLMGLVVLGVGVALQDDAPSSQRAVDEKSNTEDLEQPPAAVAPEGPAATPEVAQPQSAPVPLGPSAALDQGGGFVYELAVLEVRDQTVSLDGEAVAPLGSHYFAVAVDVLNTEDRPGDFSLDGYSVPYPADAESRAVCQDSIGPVDCDVDFADITGFTESFEPVRSFRIPGGERATLYFEFLIEDEVAAENDLAITSGDFVLPLPSGD